MPGPFPGMDPYLESRYVWRDVHHELISKMREQLNEVLPPDYVTRIDERLFISEPPRSIFPDMTVARLQEPPAPRGGTAVLNPPQAEPQAFDTPYLVYDYTTQIHEAYIEIVKTDGTGRVVTVVELVSPANKMRGVGRDEYLRKQDEVLRSEIHLLEIDLLRTGDSPVAIDVDRLRSEQGGWQYLVSLVRAGRQAPFEVWPRSVRERLPRVRVPLDRDRPDVPLDVQDALDRAYDAGRYALSIDYRHDPEPPLGPEDAAWADALLREKGLRP